MRELELQHSTTPALLSLTSLILLDNRIHAIPVRIRREPLSLLIVPFSAMARLLQAVEEVALSNQRLGDEL